MKEEPRTREELFPPTPPNNMLSTSSPRWNYCDSFDSLNFLSNAALEMEDAIHLSERANSAPLTLSFSSRKDIFSPQYKSHSNEYSKKVVGNNNNNTALGDTTTGNWFLTNDTLDDYIENLDKPNNQQSSSSPRKTGRTTNDQEQNIISGNE